MAVPEVYVIDDDEALRLALKRVLQHAGVLVRTYGSALEFLEEAPRLSPGCVIADLRMPGMDGMEFIRWIAASGLPFTAIMMTGRASVGLAEGVMKASATHIVRSLREASDFNEGLNLHGVAGRVDPPIPMAHFICEAQFLHVSLSTDEELDAMGERIGWLVMPCVEAAFAARALGLDPTKSIRRVPTTGRPRHRQRAATDRAAVSISFATTSGWDT